MSSTFYDPEKTPDPQQWLALGEHERIRLSKNYHEAARIKLPNAKAHALIHAVVENQIAMGFGPSCRAIERLQREGLTRHEAVHAIGSIVAQFIYEAATAQSQTQADLQSRMNVAIESLTPDEWNAQTGDAGQ